MKLQTEMTLGQGGGIKCFNSAIIIIIIIIIIMNCCFYSSAEYCAIKAFSVNTVVLLNLKMNILNPITA